MIFSYNKGVLKVYMLFCLYIPILCAAYGSTLYIDSSVVEMENFKQ